MRALALALAFLLAAGSARAESLTVFAAASLKNAFDAIGAAFEAETGAQVIISYAGTSALARQIEQGAPADVFASAHPDWLSYLAVREAVDWQSLTPFASNALVLVAPADSGLDAPIDLTSADDVLSVLGEDGRLAVALTQAVPAGVYAREALEALGLWDQLQPRLAETDNVRTALLLVARGEAPLGIVYASDAEAEPRVVALQALDPDLHTPIAYSAVRVTQSENPHAERFLRFLQAVPARTLLVEHGFAPPAM